jgi:hypothetical protein
LFIPLASDYFALLCGRMSTMRSACEDVLECRRRRRLQIAALTRTID